MQKKHSFASFLNDERSLQLALEAIDKLENDLYEDNDANDAYSAFHSLIIDETETKLNKVKTKK